LYTSGILDGAMFFIALIQLIRISITEREQEKIEYMEPLTATAPIKKKLGRKKGFPCNHCSLYSRESSLFDY